MKRLSALPGWLPLLLLLVVVQGFLYLFLLPPWQHYDEPTHFEYVWLIANRGELPEESALDRTMRREVAASMLVHDFYWNVPAPLLIDDARPLYIGVTELTHPPLYYLVASLPLRLARHLDVTTQLYLARGVSLLLLLLTSLVTVGLMRDLTPPGHPLRWLVPFAVALLPPFLNQMTAVNNDVGAVLIFSLFLWGAVRLLHLGFSWPRLAWVVVTALLAPLVKSTVGLALPLLPLLLLLTLWLHQGWRWRWLALSGVLLLGLGLFATLDWADAAYWYREGYRLSQPSPTRRVHPEATMGREVIQLEVNAEGRGRRLLNPLSPEASVQLKGKTVTVGGWLWASRPSRVGGPGIIVSMASRRELLPMHHPITVTQSPTLVFHTFEVPTDTGRLFYSLASQLPKGEQEPLYLYLDGAFLIEGTLPEGATPELEGDKLQWKGEQWPNLVRNPSGEVAGLRVRPWLEQGVGRYSPRSLSFIVASLLDREWAGSWLVELILPWLVSDFFTGFAWGHVRLAGSFWAPLFLWLFALAGVGSLLWAWRSRAAPARLHVTLLFLGLAMALMWVNALLWPLPYPWSSPALPAFRYVIPAVIPTLLFLLAGWGALWPRRYRLGGMLLLLLGLVLLNLLAYQTIHGFYQEVALMKRFIR